MDTSPHALGTLFAQLGLPSDTASCEAFLESHSLEDGEMIAEAPFWTPSQAEFLRAAFDEDSDWCEAVDDLAARLTKH